MAQEPIIPPEWDDEVKWHPVVTAAIAEGFCPRHQRPLRPDGECAMCGIYWELASYAGTVPSTQALRLTPSGATGYPHFAQTDGTTTVLVARDL